MHRDRRGHGRPGPCGRAVAERSRPRPQPASTPPHAGLLISRTASLRSTALDSASTVTTAPSKRERTAPPARSRQRHTARAVAYTDVITVPPRHPHAPNTAAPGRSVTHSQCAKLPPHARLCRCPRTASRKKCAALRSASSATGEASTDQPDACQIGILKRLAGLRVMEAFVVLTPTLDDGLLRGAIVVSGRHHRCGTGHVYHHDRMHPISGGR